MTDRAAVAAVFLHEYIVDKLRCSSLSMFELIFLSPVKVCV